MNKRIVLGGIPRQIGSPAEERKVVSRYIQEQRAAADGGDLGDRKKSIMASIRRAEQRIAALDRAARKSRKNVLLSWLAADG